MYQLKIYSLEGCPYSMNAEKLLKNNNIDFNLIKVSYDEKDHYKQLNKMNTFPQIFLETNQENIKIGGYSDLNDIYNTINDNTTFDNMLSKLRTKLTFQNTLNEKKNILKIISILLDKK
jgi:glutaredoxin